MQHVSLSEVPLSDVSLSQVITSSLGLLSIPSLTSAVQTTVPSAIQDSHKTQNTHINSATCFEYKGLLGTHGLGNQHNQMTYMGCTKERDSSTTPNLHISYQKTPLQGLDPCTITQVPDPHTQQHTSQDGARYCFSQHTQPDSHGNQHAHGQQHPTPRLQTWHTDSFPLLTPNAPLHPPRTPNPPLAKPQSVPLTCIRARMALVAAPPNMPSASPKPCASTYSGLQGSAQQHSNRV
jgi:hypothetical protein